MKSWLGSFMVRPGRGAGWASGLVATVAVTTAATLSGCAFDGDFERGDAASACHGVIAGYYCVKPNDTLQSVAFAFGRTARDVAQWNSLEENAPLHAGQTLRMGPPDWRAWHDGASAQAQPSAGAVSASASSRFVWPVSGVIVREFGADGARGIEITGHAGTPIRAAAPGRVVYAGDSIKAYGLMVIVKHENGYVTAYGNNRRLLVAEGDPVQQGASIAEMGARADGQALLQFEMREGGKPVDPLAHLPAGSGPLTQP